jgi:hypothetical protein
LAGIGIRPPLPLHSPHYWGRNELLESKQGRKGEGKEGQPKMATENVKLWMSPIIQRALPMRMTYTFSFVYNAQIYENEKIQ